MEAKKNVIEWWVGVTGIKKRCRKSDRHILRGYDLVPAPGESRDTIRPETLRHLINEAKALVIREMKLVQGHVYLGYNDVEIESGGVFHSRTSMPFSAKRIDLTQEAK